MNNRIQVTNSYSEQSASSKSTQSVAPVSPPAPSVALSPSEFLQSPVITLEHIEPEPGKVVFTADDLTKHIHIFGQTGSGKSTHLNHMLQDVIRFKADDPALKTGLLIFDFKNDDTVSRIRQMCREAGREEDLIVLSDACSVGYNILGEISTLQDAESFVQQVSLLCPNEDSSFFDENRKVMLKLGITLYKLMHNKDDYLEFTEFLNALLMQPKYKKNNIEGFKKDYERKEQLPPELRITLDFVFNTLEMWDTLDSRTKSNCQATLLNTLKTLQNPSAMHYFSASQNEGVTSIDLGEIIDKGKIVVFSTNSTVDYNFSRFFAIVLRCAFFQRILDRREQHSTLQRLVGIVTDEFPVVAVGSHPLYGDVQMLQTIRSKGAFFIAASQGLTNIRNAIGHTATEALMVNFASCFYGKSNELVLSDYVQLQWGKRIVREKINYDEDESHPPAYPGQFPTGSHPAPSLFAIREAWNCPIGTLGTLETHSFYFYHCSGTRSETALWFPPCFINTSGTQPHTKARRTSLSFKEIRETDYNSNFQPPKQHPDESGFFLTDNDIDEGEDDTDEENDEETAEPETENFSTDDEYYLNEYIKQHLAEIKEYPQAEVPHATEQTDPPEFTFSPSRVEVYTQMFPLSPDMTPYYPNNRNQNPST